MTSYVTPKKNTAFIFYTGLPSASSPGVFQANPTLAAGDFKVSIDGGALANLATLPTVTPAAGKMVKLSLSSDEMNGDNITVVCSDAAGAEWNDVVINIQTSTRQIDDLAYPTTSGRSIDVTAGGEVGIDWANIGSPTTTVNLSGTTVKTATDVEADTQDIQSRLPATLVSGRIDASVGAMATDTLTAAALASDAVTEIQSGLSTLTAAGVRSAVGLASANLDTQLSGINSKTTNLPASPAATGDIPSAAAIADAVWDEATSGHQTAGSTGKALTDAGSAGDPWSTAVPGAYGAGTAGYILGTNLDAKVSTRASQTSVDTIDDYIDTEVAAIKAKTDNLPANPAAVSDIPTAAQNATAVLTTQMTESYATDGAAPTLAQAIFNTMQSLTEFSISGTTITVKKLDGSTTAATYTLNDATTPTSRTRSG